MKRRPHRSASGKLSVRKQCELPEVKRNRLTPRKARRVEGAEAVMGEWGQGGLTHGIAAVTSLYSQ